MQFNANKILNYILLCNNNKYPISKCHYVTGQDISIFTNLVCIEKNLTALTCNCKQICKKNGCFNYRLKG